MNPQELAAKILEAVNKSPDAFDMDWWFTPGDAESPFLAPEDEPTCGTTMCVAGWAAHLLGWTIVQDGTAFARKDGVNRDVDEVARIALGLLDYQADDLFYATEAEARKMLRAIADGEDW